MALVNKLLVGEPLVARHAFANKTSFANKR